MLNPNIEKKESLHQEILVQNIARLKYLCFFLLAFLSLMLYIDFFGESNYTMAQLSVFKVVDLSLFVFIIVGYFILFVSTNISLKFKEVLFYFYLLVFFVWAVIISYIENSTLNELRTYLIGIFTLAALFYLPMWYLLLLNGIGVGIIQVLNSRIADSANLFSFDELSFFAMIALSIFISYVSLKNFKNTLHSKLELEEAKNGLNKQVKERTAALNQSNIKLQEEIDRRVVYERDLEEQRIKAINADKIKTVFLANMSHELRTPLNGIIGFSQLLLVGKATVAKIQRYAKLILNNGNHLLQIIEDLLDISMIETKQLNLNKQEFLLNDVFHHLSENAKVIYNREKMEVKFILDAPIEIKKLHIINDKGRLLQVFNNLINNAFKFTSEGYVKIGSEERNNELLFFVEDTGSGIEESIKDLIFEQFRLGDETMNRVHGGPGLGLPIAKGIVNAWGGSIWVDDTYKNGARFYFTLPLS